MHVLHVLAERGFSGGEHQLAHLLRFLEAQGHRSTLVLSPGAAFEPTARALDLACQPLAMRNDLDLWASWRLRRLWHGLRPDLVHLACSRSHKIGAAAALGTAGRPPLVVTRRMDYPIPRTPYRRWLYGRAVGAVVAVSDGVRREVLRIGVDPDRVHLIHDGVEPRPEGWRSPAARSAARGQLAVAGDTWCGLTIASLHRRKGLDVLIEALDQLALPEGVRLIWLVAGDGPLRAELAAQGRALPSGVELRLLGHVSPVDRLLLAADVFCLPSRLEGLGVALLEAMAAGLPVVASSVGGMREAVVAGDSGLLVPAEDPRALAAALRELWSDRERAARMAAAGRARVVAEFTVDRMCRATEALYLRLAAG
jgi:glycosyltransferase involved in cell wall biosynthesis